MTRTNTLVVGLLALGLGGTGTAQGLLAIVPDLLRRARDDRRGG